MSCHDVRKLIAPFLARDLGPAERARVLEHLASCPECGALEEFLAQERNMLRALPPRAVPARLAADLRNLAFRERLRRLSQASARPVLRVWWDRLELMVDNMMRPMALPFAGGILSALVMFGMLVPTLNFHHNFSNDVPILTGMYTNPTLEEVSPFCNGQDETVLELTIDEKGRLADFRVSQGEMSKQLANDLLFSRFAPATIFGQPTSGKLFLTFRRGRTIVVKG